jgi:hypothetical protein
MSWSLSWRAWQDVRRFGKLSSFERRVVFYAEDGTALAYLGSLAEALVKEHGIEVCYLTSSPTDIWLTKPPSGIKPFFIGNGSARTALFMGLEAKVVVMTMPDLETFHLKRSKVGGVHYIYVFHSLVSTHMIYRPGAFDHFDTIFCAGPHHINEIRRNEAVHHLKPKQLVEHGYSRLDTLLSLAPQNSAPDNIIKRVLIAPSWGDQGLLETQGEELINILLEAGYHVTLRPHPMTLRRHPGLLISLLKEFGTHSAFNIGKDIGATEAFFQNDIMISDWSGAALEYALVRQRPVIFVDVPRKINNPDYENLGIEPLEVSVRHKIGVIVSANDLSSLPERLKCIDIKQFQVQIAEQKNKIVFNVGRSSQVGAAHIARILKDG